MQPRAGNKTNRTSNGDEKRSNLFDRCQTPAYSLTPIYPYIQYSVVWECAAGEGILVEAMRNNGNEVIASDILTGQNFFDWQPERWDCIITNPPFSIKYLFLERCYQLGKPFALLMPVEIMGVQKAQKQFKKYGINVILLNKRINFKMPRKGYSGGGSWFPVAWYTWKMGVKSELSFADISYDESIPLNFMQVSQ